MNDTLEELLEIAEQVPVPIDPPSEEDILDAQEQIFLPISQEYRDFLLYASHLCVGSLEPATAGDPNSHTYLPEVCSVAWDQGFPRHLVAICAHPHGYYGLTPEGTVQNWANGQMDETEWDSVWEWAQDVWATS